MKTNILSIIVLLASVALFTTCGQQTKPETAEADKHAQEEEHAAKQVSLTALQRQTIGLKLGNIQHRNMTGTYR